MGYRCPFCDAPAFEHLVQRDQHVIREHHPNDPKQAARALVAEVRALERKRWSIYCDHLAVLIEQGKAPQSSASVALRSMAKSLREATDED